MQGLESAFKSTLHSLEHLAISANSRLHHTHLHESVTLDTPTTQTQWEDPQTSNTTYYESCNGPCSQLVYPDPETGNLVYPPYNEKGDRIIDFSGAGYNEGRTDIPSLQQVPVIIALEPTQDTLDDSERIQNALIDIGNFPELPNGFKGALQLNRGTYYLSKPIEMRNSGVVLQGDPSGGTVLVATDAMSPLDTPYLIKVAGQPNAMARKRVAIADEYVPVGHYQIRVTQSKKFKQGDTVVVGIGFNENWIEAIGMHDIPAKPGQKNNNGWRPGRFEHHRRLVRVEDDGKLLTLNEPLTTSLAKEYGGGYVEAYENMRVQRVGIQYLECVFPANKSRGPEEMMKTEKKKVKDYRFTAEMFDHLLIYMDHAENCWIKNVKSVWWRNFARLGTNTVAITLQNCYHTFPQAPPPNPKKPAFLVGQFAFEISGQMILIDRCHAEYNFHAYSYKGRVPGPNVVYKSNTVAKNGDIGPHMKWSSGQLYDNCNIEGQILIQDRFDAGSGHGWSGANSVVWNTVAHGGMVVQKPPLANNFVVGCSSKKAKARRPGHPWGWEESPDVKVEPPSLYLAQLRERRRMNTV
ncbi:hypothetical protein CLU79DRAFT_774200 [Phycomyces nitens]|nr:hypothetical protein CLU79DRAFT_774200 [Phycomyces nitens]